MKTTFKLTKSLLDLENEILRNMDIPRTTFHRRAIDFFLKSDRKINPRLLITDRTNPNYVNKEAVEQIYLDDDRKAALHLACEQNNCGITVVLFQALLDYCSVQAPIVLGDMDHYKND